MPESLTVDPAFQNIAKLLYYWIVLILLHYFSYKSKICVVVKRIKETNAHDDVSFACWSETVRVITWRKSVHLVSCRAFVARTVHISNWLDASVCVRESVCVCVYVCARLSRPDDGFRHAFQVKHPLQTLDTQTGRQPSILGAASQQSHPIDISRRNI